MRGTGTVSESGPGSTAAGFGLIAGTVSAELWRSGMTARRREEEAVAQVI